MLQFARLFTVFNHQVLVTAAVGTVPCHCQQCQEKLTVPVLRITTHVFRNNTEQPLEMDIPCPDALQQMLALRKFEGFHAQRAFSVLQGHKTSDTLALEIEALKHDLFSY